MIKGEALNVEIPASEESIRTEFAKFNLMNTLKKGGGVWIRLRRQKIKARVLAAGFFAVRAEGRSEKQPVADSDKPKAGIFFQFVPIFTGTLVGSSRLCEISGEFNLSKARAVAFWLIMLGCLAACTVWLRRTIIEFLDGEPWMTILVFGFFSIVPLLFAWLVLYVYNRGFLIHRGEVEVMRECFRSLQIKAEAIDIDPYHRTT